MCESTSRVLNFIEEGVRALPCSDDKDVDALSHYASTLRVLMSNASSSKWKPEFTKILKESSEMRAPILSVEEKAQYPCRCMACGSHEESNIQALDLGGVLQGELSDASTVLSQWEDNQKHQDWIMQNPGHTHVLLHPLDAGRYMLGETCLRRAQLYFLCRTWLYEIYRVTRDHIELMRDKDGALHPKKRYMLACDEVKRWHASFDRLQELVRETSNKPLHASCIPYDHVFWEHIDLARGNACKWDPTTLIDRMNDVEREDAIEKANEDMQQPTTKRGHKRQRRQVIGDDDESSDDSNESSDDSNDDSDCNVAQIASPKTRHGREKAYLEKKTAMLALIDVQRELTEQGQFQLVKKVTHAIMFMQA